MIFLDSNIIIELLNDDTVDRDGWLETTFANAVRQGGLVCNLVVFAEVAAGLAEPGRLPEHLDELTIEVVDVTVVVAFRAAKAHREYRRRGGPRSTILPDFLIAGHAAVLGASFMTRDRRLATYFPELTLITPETRND